MVQTKLNIGAYIYQDIINLWLLKRQEILKKVTCSARMSNQFLLHKYIIHSDLSEYDSCWF